MSNLISSKWEFLRVNLKINVPIIIPSVKPLFYKGNVALATHRLVFLSAWEVNIWNSNPTDAEIYSKSRARHFFISLSLLFLFFPSYLNSAEQLLFPCGQLQATHPTITQHYATSNKRLHRQQGSLTREGVKRGDLATTHGFGLLSRQWSMEADASIKFTTRRHSALPIWSLCELQYDCSIVLCIAGRQNFIPVLWGSKCKSMHWSWWAAASKINLEQIRLSLDKIF